MLREVRFILEWVIIELIILSTIPLLISNKGFNGHQTATKYFLRQSPASLTILITFIIIKGGLSYFILFCRLIFKLGIPPFHGWVFRLLSGLSSKEMFVLLCVQKFPPITLIENLVKLELLILLSASGIVFVLAYMNSICKLMYLLLMSSIARSY